MRPLSIQVDALGLHQGDPMPSHLGLDTPQLSLLPFLDMEAEGFVGDVFAVELSFELSCN
jgi:hypothetical protein